MRRGDILLVKYLYDPIGWLIRRFTHGQWNHVVWILDKYSVIEIKGKGIFVSPIAKYLNKRYYKCKLVRIKKIEKKNLNKAINYVLIKKGKYSYCKLLLSFLMILFKSKKQLPRPTCSGLIAESLAKVGWYFNSKNVNFITPQCIVKSKKVKEITNELRCFNTSL